MENKNKFKRGEVYKALTTLRRVDPEGIELCTNLFTKDRIYRCKQDGTLHSYGSFKDEKIYDEHNNCFELVGHFIYKLNDEEIHKTAMHSAFNDIFYKNLTFEQFYDKYVEEYKKIKPVEESIDEDRILYLNGQVGYYWDEHSESKSLI